MKKILVIGGTNFVGRVFCELLEKQNRYDVTLFNRGKTNPELFPGFNRITGDRETDDILKITQQNWDCVIDISSYYPNTLEKLLHAMKGKMNRYVYISTVSVFQVNQLESALFREDSPTTECTEADKTNTDISTYSQRKSESERIILQQDWLDKIILRPSLIFGKYDPTDRVYYWLYRAWKNKKILVPENGDRLLSYTYVEDLARLMLDSIEIQHHREVYNAVTIRQTSFREIIAVASGKYNTNPELINISFPDFLRKKLNQWTDLPLYIANIDHVSENTRVIEDFKIQFESLKQSLYKTLDYYKSLGWPEPKAGISESREKELIEAVSSDQLAN